MSRWEVIFGVGLLVMGCELVQMGPGEYHARLEDAGGLAEGAAVFVAGVRVGRVASVKLEGDHARVDFTLNDDADVILHEDACVAVGWYAKGDAHLRLRLGKETMPPLKSGSEIKCVEEVGGRAEQWTARVDQLLTDLMKGKGTLGRLLRDEQLADKVERYFEQPREAAAAPAASASAAIPPTVGSAQPPKAASSAGP